MSFEWKETEICRKHIKWGFVLSSTACSAGTMYPSCSASKALLRCSSHYSVSSSWNFLLSFASCSSIPLLCHYVLRWIYYAFTIHQKWVYCSQLIRIPQRIRACDKNSEHIHGIQFGLVPYGKNLVVISARDGIIEPKHAGSAWNVQKEVPEEEHHNETREAQNMYV